MSKTFNLVLSVTTILALVPVVSSAFAANLLTPSQSVSALQKGGYILYMRHASTEKDYADQVTADVANCATQRTLSENGWNEAETIGSAVSLLGIPVGALYSSQYCRAWQTARIAFGTPTKMAEFNFAPVETMNAEQTAQVSAAVTPFLSATPAEGTNTVIVAHDDPFEAATGIYPEPQGVVYVLKPDGESFTIVGSINPDEWVEVLASK